MSADPATSYLQGRAEAEAASTKAASIGLTNNGLGGTIIYYDMEVFGGASLACRQATASFINGWVERLHELGNYAGGYGSHNSYVEDWATIVNVPNDIWAASWYTTNYDAAASVYGISWLNGMWTNHQRIRQYAGDHSERWGEIKLTIDSDVADGMVAMPSGKKLSNPLFVASPSIEDSGWLTPEQGWLVSESHLYWTDVQGKNWQDISPGRVQMAYFLQDGQAWAISTLDYGQIGLYHSSDGGSTWDTYEADFPLDAWTPLQLRFTSADTGWMVLKKSTSQAFDAGTLLKTSDGGLTWLEYELPGAAPIRFTSPSEGWLVTSLSNETFVTHDGGITWQPAQLGKYLLSQPPLPEDSIRSGWLTDSLGWSVTSSGSCTGEKSSPSFTCQSDTLLWQTVNGGQDWQPIPLPSSMPAEP